MPINVPVKRNDGQAGNADLIKVWPNGFATRKASEHPDQCANDKQTEVANRHDAADDQLPQSETQLMNQPVRPLSTGERVVSRCWTQMDPAGATLIDRAPLHVYESFIDKIPVRLEFVD